MKKFAHNNSIVAVSVISTMLLGVSLILPVSALAASSPSLGTLSTYAIVSSTFTNSNTAPQTIIDGARCDTTAPTTAPITTTGAITTGGCDPALGTTQTSVLANLNSQACVSLGGAVNLDNVAGHTTGIYTPGCYSSTGAMNITTGATVTLNGAGTYIFRPGGALTTEDNTFVVLSGGASATDVFWVPVGATTLGAYTTGGLPPATPTFVGNIFRGNAAGLSITLGHFANLLGRALAFGSTVTTDANTITVPTATTLATLHIIKTVVNNSGGTAIASDFNLHVKLAGTDVANSPLPGVGSPGTSYSLPAGTYVVSEDYNSAYTPSFSVDCTSSGNVTLSSGDDKTCTVTNTDIPSLPPPPPPAPSGSSSNYFEPLPLINVTKIPNPLALPNGAGSVTYTYTVTNVGLVAMGGVWVKDDKCSPVNFISGDTNKDSKLGLDEIWKYSCMKTVSVTETNTATTHGNASGWDGYDTANATVVVGNSSLPPLIHLVKKPNIFVLPFGGGAVTYTYTVTNPGTVPLSNVSITDNKCTGLPGRVSGHPGDLNKNNLLESNEVWSFTCQTYISQTTTNIGTATGYANGLVTIDYSSATVAVNPSTSVATFIPGLPNTGIGPDNSDTVPWLIGLSGIFVGLLSYYILRKRPAAKR